MATAFEASFPGTPLGVRMLRRQISAIAMDCGMDPEGIADVRLAVTEAATNAVVHTYEKRQGGLSVSADVREGELLIVIADTGQGVAVNRDTAGLGLGLPLIASVASRFKIRQPAPRHRDRYGVPLPPRRAGVGALTHSVTERDAVRCPGSTGRTGSMGLGPLQPWVLARERRTPPPGRTLVAAACPGARRDGRVTDTV